MQWFIFQTVPLVAIALWDLKCSYTHHMKWTDDAQNALHDHWQYGLFGEVSLNTNVHCSQMGGESPVAW